MSDEINNKNEFYTVHFKGFPFHIWENKLYRSLAQAKKARPLQGPHAKYWEIHKVRIEPY